MLGPNERSLHRGDRGLGRRARSKLHKAAPFARRHFRVEHLAEVAEGSAELRVPGIGEVSHKDGSEVGVGGGGVPAAAAAVAVVSSVHGVVVSSVASGAAAASEAPKLASSGATAKPAKAAVAAASSSLLPTTSSHHSTTSSHHLAALFRRRGGDADRPVAEGVSLHPRQRGVALASVAEAHEAVTARASRGRVSDNLRGADRREEGAEGFLEGEVGDLGCEVADEDGVVGWIDGFYFYFWCLFYFEF